jgi:hypothetical protein
VPYTYGPLRGAWCGDRVYAAGDEHGPDLHGVKTSTLEDPMRNLYGLAHDEYEDVSYAALAMLCEDEWTAGVLVGKVAADVRDPTRPQVPDLIGHLGNVVLRTGCAPLRAALAEQLGGRSGWRRLYAERCEADRHSIMNHSGVDPWNALWALPPAARFGAMERGVRTARGPAWTARDATQVVEHALHLGFVVIRVEAWLITSAGDEGYQWHGVVDRWTAGPASPEDSWDTYLPRAAARAAEAIAAMDARLPAEQRGLVRYAVTLHGCEPSWRSRLPYDA